jgi:hypothetical protein
MNRRDLMRLGLGGVVGAVATQDILAQRKSPIITKQDDQDLIVNTKPSAKEAIEEFDFLLKPGVTSRISKETNNVISTSTWAVPSQFESYVPALLSTAAPSLSELEVWAKNLEGRQISQVKHQSVGMEAFEALIKTSLSGDIDVTDIAGAAAVAITERRKLDLALNF